MEDKLPLDVRTDGDSLVITINKPKAKELSPHNLQRLLAFMVCTIRDEKVESYRKPIPAADIPKLDYVPRRPHIGVFMESTDYYSGGRYWALIFSKLLTHVADVTIVTNLRASYVNDMDLIPGSGKFNVVVDNGYGMYVKQNEFDIVLGVPITACEFARAYAGRFKLPFYMLLFETPNWIRVGKGGLSGDSTEEFWRGYKNSLKYADKVICLSKEGMAWAIDWAAGKPPAEKFEYVYPCVNSTVADVVMTKKQDPENSVVFVGRAGDHKEPCEELSLLLKAKPRPLGLKVYVVGKMGRVVEQRMGEVFKAQGVPLVIADGISDREKFEIIARCKVLMFPSYFEGFGIPPGEALYMGKPTVAYDLKVLREFYGNVLYFVERGNKQAFVDKLLGFLNDSHSSDMTVDRARYAPYLSVRGTVRRVVDSMFPIKLSVGMIVFNGDDYLEASLEGIYDMAHEIVIAEGAVKDFMFAANPDGSSTDRTVEIIKSFPDPGKKIRIIQGKWESKMHMQNAIAEHITGDIFLKLDSDEFYHSNDLLRILDMFRADKDLWIVRYRFNHFWHRPDLIAVGSQWESKMTRIWRWDRGFRHPLSDGRGFNYFVDANGRKVDLPTYKVLELPDRLVYHFAYLKNPEKIRDKLRYYGARNLGEIVTDTWTGWKRGDPTQPTHGGGDVERFEGVLPEAVRNHPLILKAREEVT